jgi:hypothetical protein
MSPRKSKSPAPPLRRDPPLVIERVQTGVRMEKRMVKVLKAIAEVADLSLGELLEDIVLHSFEGNGANAFGPSAIQKIKDLKRVYGMDYDVHATYRFREPSPSKP